jgi:FixJ family two-component response regulator
MASDFPPRPSPLVPHTIFVVDDDASLRKSLGRLLKSAGHLVEAFASADEFLRRDHYEGLGCLVLDVQMPGLNGIELQSALAEKEYGLPIVFVTGHGDIPMGVRAMKSGAVDFLPKPFNDDALLKAIDQALDRCRQERETRAEAADIRSRLATLTPREREVLAHVVTGKLNKQIAADLGAAEKTIKVHRGRVMQKMKVRSVAELVRIAEKAGVTGREAIRGQ